MDAILQPAAPLRGTVTVPPDKAICHRAALIAAVASGPTVIRPWPAADDCQRTLQVVEALGVAVSRTGQDVTIAGRGLDGLRPPNRDLDCGESGTTLRLAAGLLAGQPFSSRLIAGPLLSRRPMRRIIDPLTQMGARLEGTGAASAELHPPLTIHGARPLRPLRYELPVASAQVKSAILLAGLFTNGPTVVVERRPTRDHTERMLQRCGRTVRRHGPEILLEPGPLAAAGPLVVPGDFSSAAFFLVAAACLPGSRVTAQGVSLNPTRIALLEILRRMGAGVSVSPEEDAWEPRGSVTVEAQPLRGVTVEPDEVPGLIDELPALMVAAACAVGPTRLVGVGELRVKETDRAGSMVDGLQRLGATIRVIPPDTVDIQGGGLAGGEVNGAGDHRTVMSLAIAGLAARPGPTVIRGAECVAKSFPEFFGVLGRLTGSPTVKTVDKA